MNGARMARRPARSGLFRRWRRDERGVSALEFALTAPVFLAALVGFSEFGEFDIASRNVSNVTTAVGDMTGQLKSATAQVIDDEFAAANILMAPIPTHDLAIRVTSVVPVMTNGAVTGAKVDWCRTSDPQFACPAKDATLHNLIDGQSFPLGMLPNAGASVVLCETTYTSTLQGFLPNATVIRRAYFVNPREIAKIPYS